MTERADLSDDQKTLLDAVVELCLRGHDARPSHMAHRLGWSLERVTVTMEELVALGMLQRNGRKETN